MVEYFGAACLNKLALKHLKFEPKAYFSEVELDVVRFYKPLVVNWGYGELVNL